jgi:hypothetical protein
VRRNARRPRQDHRRRHHPCGQTDGQATRHPRPRTGPDVLVAGLGCGTMSLAALEALIAGGQGPLRGCRAGPARPPRSSHPMGSTSAGGWCRRVGPWPAGGTRWATSTPRTRRARPSAGCGGAPWSSPGCGGHRRRRSASTASGRSQVNSASLSVSSPVVDLAHHGGHNRR